LALASAICRTLAASARERPNCVSSWRPDSGLPAAIVAFETTTTTPAAESGHASRTSLEIYSRLALPDAQASYDGVIGKFPV